MIVATREIGKKFFQLVSKKKRRLKIRKTICAKKFVKFLNIKTTFFHIKCSKNGSKGKKITKNFQIDFPEKTRNFDNQ